MKYYIFGMLLLAGQWQSAGAAVEVPALFSDHAVLQRSAKVPVWGRAEPGERITITLGSVRAQTAAGRDGRWRGELDLTKCGAGPFELVIEGQTKFVARDVLIGEVWLCSGQSNMQMPLREAANATEEISNANHPQLREFAVQRSVSSQPMEWPKGQWRVCSPQTAAEFSAAGYFFARGMSAELACPFGIVNSSYGGTFIEGWLADETLRSNPAFGVVFERWKKMLADYPAARAKYDQEIAAWKSEKESALAQGSPFTKPAPRDPPKEGHRYQPSGLFNAMIYPLVPYAVRGVVWYQGENNAGRAKEYTLLLESLIQSWRKLWGREDLPFYIVQLPNYNEDHRPDGLRWPALREAQANVLKLPATGLVVTIDVGDPENVHPANKQEVGRRLALLVGKEIYRLPGKVASGPIYRGIRSEGNSILVEFSVAGQLQPADREIYGFEVAGTDRVFHAAQAELRGPAVVKIVSPAVADPIAVRYAWRNNPRVNLTDGSGLPARPFRTDNWAD